MKRAFAVNSNGVTLQGSALCADIPSINGYSFTLAQASTITYQLTIALYAFNGIGQGGSFGAVSVRIFNGSGSEVSNSNSEYSVGSTAERIIVVGFGDLPAGTYTISARLVRSSTGVGNTATNGGSLGFSAGCNDIPVQSAQFIAQVFPK